MTHASEEVERVGLLFVHGIGQQKRWEHLRASVVEVAELLAKHSGKRASVSVIDRTDETQPPAGEPAIAADAPITIAYREREEGGAAIDFDCHEVWWADLGKRTGLWEAFTFWVWGLGQWGAPIYYELDASGLASEVAQQEAGREDVGAMPAASLPSAQMPRSVAIEPCLQIRSRLLLAWAALAAAFAAISISLFKRVVKFLAGATPSTTLIVDYVGDVQTYQERARPGRGPLSDPGHPWRVAIRRRMVSQMAAMGAREFDRWYILAHSLGSVVAFNGITEIGHTLPNYLPRALWESLPDRLRRDPHCAKRDDLEAMMPVRPPWLVKEDCINRPKLFEKLAGFVTYGSPLDKFAALWPRIVAVEKYGGTAPSPEALQEKVFARTRWLNILTVTDPVAGHIGRYEPHWMRIGEHDLPHLVNVARPDPQWFGLSHVQYFQVQARGMEQDHHSYYQKLFRWLVTDRLPEAAGARSAWHDLWERYEAKGAGIWRLRLQAVGISLFIWLAASVIAGLALLALWSGAEGDLCFFAWVGASVASLALIGVYLCGTWRWLREYVRNRRFAEHDLKGMGKLGEHAGSANQKVRALSGFLERARAQIFVARFFFVAGLAILVALAAAILDPQGWSTFVIIALGGAIFAMLLLGASMTQAVIDYRLITKLEKELGTGRPRPADHKLCGLGAHGD